jgi:ribose transport system permease protein/putative xylitol transport system permease protein
MAVATATHEAQPHLGGAVARAHERYGHLIYPLVAIAGLVIWFSIATKGFITVDNLWNIGRQSSVLLVASLAGTLIILIGSIDLSVGAIVTLGGIVCAQVINSSGPIAGVAAALVIGALVGLANGTLLLKLKIPSFLVTLGTLSVVGGIAAGISDSTPVPFSDQGLPNFVNGEAILGIPNVIVLTLVILGLLTVMLSRTKFGRYLYAIGGGEPVAAVSGVPVGRYKVGAFVLGGVLSAIAGVLLAGQVSAGTLESGQSLLLDSIAAVVMGGTSLSGGVGGAHRTLLGVLVIGILSNGMDLIGYQETTQEIVKGCVIIAAVALSIDRKKYTFIK